MSALRWFIVTRNVAIALTAIVGCWPNPANTAHTLAARASVTDEPIAPVPHAPKQDKLKIALGERLFRDARLSRDNNRSCATCHNLAGNGATRNTRDTALDGSSLHFNTISIFNAALNFRLGWQGDYRSLELYTAATIRKPTIMGSSLALAVAKLAADPGLVRQFKQAYGRGPDPQNLLDAIATFGRSLVTPDSRFDRWLAGDAAALSAQELSGYRQFKLLGCAACHQGANVGGNLYQDRGVVPQVGTSSPRIVRVPSLRNVAVTAPYFHDGSAQVLEEAVICTTAASGPSMLSKEHAKDIAAFLRTLTGTYQGRPLEASQ